MNTLELISPDLSFRAVARDVPVPGPGEVLVRLRAASLNYIDVAVATGQFPGATFPLVPVADGAGEVAAIGPQVAGWSVGDRVIPHFLPDWTAGAISPQRVGAMRGITRPGSLADYVAVPAASLVPAPAHLDFVQAATLPIAATTAWNAVRAAQLRPGAVVVLLGTGGVSLFALQFAKASGAEVIVTSSSDAKLARAQALGADHLINYRSTPDWDREVLRLTGGRGADLVVETAGAETFQRALLAAAPGGTVFSVGFLSGATTAIDLFPLITKALRVVGNNTGSVADLADAARAVAAHRIVPVVDDVFDVTDARAAYLRMQEGGRHFGKLAFVHPAAD